MHNLNVLQCGGELKILRRPSSLDKLTYKDFTPCTHCLGFVQKHQLWRHNKTCPYRENEESEPKFGRLQHESEILLYGSVEGASNDYADMKNNVLHIMIPDDISDIVKQDRAILNYRSFLFTSGGTEKKSTFHKR